MMDGAEKNELTSLLDVEPENLLEKVQMYWFSGEWEMLSVLSLKSVKKHPERAKIILFVASAYQQLGYFSKANLHYRKAIKLGCETRLVAKVCIVGAYNILGRIAALELDDEKMKKDFLTAIDIGLTKDTDLVAHSRAVKEMSKIGLLPQASNLIKEKLKVIVESPSENKDMEAKIKILQTELELLTHELSISQQRMQLYRTEGKEEKSTEKDINIDSDAYMESLKNKSVSQLGQDIWVLEKTNFKKGGFFVEFGATDGVLLSNTYLLEKEFGWKGICAEPNPKFFKDLKKNRNCTVSDACIGAKTGEKIEFIFAQEYGGMLKYAAGDSHADKREAYANQGNMAELTTISLHDFLVSVDAPKKIDYLSIDTEGSEFEILENFPFEQWDINLLTVEHNNTELKDKIFQLLSNYGYTRKTVNWDDWYIKPSYKE